MPSRPESPPTSSVPAHPLARCLAPRLGLHGCHGCASVTGTDKLFRCAPRRSRECLSGPAAGRTLSERTCRTQRLSRGTVGRWRYGDFGRSREETAGGTRPDQRCGPAHSHPSVTWTNTPTSRVPRQGEQRPSLQAMCPARTSHGTYIMYMEPFFHFGCISTTSNCECKGAGRTR